MQRNILIPIVQTLAFIALCVLVLFSVAQVNHLEHLVDESEDRATELTQAVQALERELRSGALTAAAPSGAVEAGTAAQVSADPNIEYHRQFYSAEDWSALNAPGNYLVPRTDRFNVEGAVAGGTIHRAFISDIPGLNWVVNNAADISELYSYVTETLATRQRTDPNRWIPQLAHRIEVSDDFREYHVYLRKGVMWHPPAVDLGDPRYAWLAGPHEVVADDFVFYLEIIQNTQVEAAHIRNYYEKCEGIEVINDHEFIVRWSETTYPSISFTLGLSPLPRWLYGYDEDGNAFDAETLGRQFNSHWYNQRAIGMGPYRFVEWERGGAIRLERNEDYYGERPPIDTMEFVVVADATARLNNLRAGDLDYIPLQPTQYNNEITNGGTPGFTNGELLNEVYQGPAYRYLGWNADGKFFNDRRVRLAMTYALNRQLLLEENFFGLGTLTTGPFMMGSPDYNLELEPHPFDLNRAAELLEEAGWTDGNGDGIREKMIDGQMVNFEFGMVTYGYRPEWVAAMDHYRNDLRRIGVVMNVEPVEWAVMTTRMEEKDFDAYTGGWQLGWDNDPYQIWHSSQADAPRSSNRVGFRNPEADQIIEECRRTFDPAERATLLRRFHEIVYEEQPYTFWFSDKQIGAWRSNLQNVNFSVMRPFDQSLNWYLASP
jgi:peptide/nickel transport system substrate-binding protein